MEGAMLFERYRHMLSDVVVKENLGYLNVMTGVEGRNINDVTSGRHYILLPDSHGCDGYCVVYENGTLHMFILCFSMESLSWECTGYFGVPQKTTGIHDIIDSMMESGIGYRHVDAFGQYCPQIGKNIAVGSFLCSVSFFCGLPLRALSPLYDMGHLASTLRVLSEMEHSNIFHIGVYDPYGMGDLGSLPEQVSESAYTYMDDVNALDGRKEAGFLKPKNFCIIGFYNGEPVIRLFTCMIVADENGKPYCHGFFEYMKLRMEDIGSESVNGADMPILWIDDRAADVFRFPCVGVSLGVAALFFFHPVTENLYKQNIQKFHAFLDECINLRIESTVQCIIGETYEGKNLHQRLGVPKHMVNGYSFEEMKKFKLLFSSCRDYFMQMDAGAVCRAAQVLSDLTMDEVRNASVLISVYGPEQHLKFMHYSGKLNGMPGVYGGYFDSIRSFDKDERKYFKWEFDGYADYYVWDRIVYYLAYKGITSLRCPVYLDDTIGRYHYSSHGLSIQIPGSILDMFEEGKSLHHCAASFVPACMEEETVILFIRRETAPEKPYFTLEIRDGKIRQCHGFANRTIRESDDYENLLSFLKGFCEDKYITFSEGSELLGL